MASVILVVEPVVVPVPLRPVPVQVQDVTVAVRVQKNHVRYHQYHYLSTESVSKLYFIQHHNASVPHTKYLHFLLLQTSSQLV